MSSSSSRTTRGDDDGSGSRSLARVERRARDDIARAVESAGRVSVDDECFGLSSQREKRMSCERVVRYGFYEIESSKILKSFECEGEYLSSRRV